MENGATTRHNKEVVPHNTSEDKDVWQLEMPWCYSLGVECWTNRLSSKIQTVANHQQKLVMILERKVEQLPD